MKDKLFLIAIFALFWGALPFIASAAGGGSETADPHDANPLPTASPSAVQDGSESRAETGDVIFHVFNVSTGEVMELPGREYIVHVVAAEMPASFEPEALKAQAVAAYTYAVFRRQGTPDPSHNGCELCTDSTHCKAYADEAYLRSLWGDQYDRWLARITDAVDAVYGQVMTYDGAPIAAVFHAISHGTTEAAVDVWGHDYPYLLPVDSSVDRRVDGFETTVTLKDDEVKRIMISYNSKCDLSGDPSTWFTDPTRTASGGVLTLKIGGVTVSGSRARELFGLRSTDFSVNHKDGQLTFTVRGYGHGVGMSQYGANLMAKDGATYDMILRHYYTGIDITHDLSVS